MLDSETKMRRLSLAKYLIEIGSINSKNNLPFSLTSILNFHDAIEIILDLIIEDSGYKSKYQFMDRLNQVNEILTNNKKNSISQTGSLNKLNKKRVALKHNGSFPSKMDIQEAQIVTLGFFEEICEKYFEMTPTDINLIYLLSDSNTKKYLLKVNPNDDMENIVSNLSIAFEYLLKDYDETKKTPLRKSPYQFLKKPQLSYKDLGLDRNNPFKKYIENTNANLKSIEENMKILALGFDFNKYAQFRLYVPKAKLIFPGEFEPELRGDESLTNNQIEFCINFIIECALKLYSVDFEVPENWGMKHV